MKTRLIVAVVVAVHCVAVGSLIIMQGCGTTKATAPMAQESVPLPPVDTPVVATRPAVKPAPVVPFAEPEPVSAKTTSYIVQSGDTLSGIAARFKVRVKDLVTLNPGMKPEKIRVGDKILLPGELDLKAFPPAPKKAKVEKAVEKTSASAKAEPASAPAASAAAPSAVVAGGNLYVVQSGDALSKIAKKFGTTSDAVRKANNLTSDKLRIGQKLAIPAKGEPAAAPAPAPAPEASPAGTPQAPETSQPADAPKTETPIVETQTVPAVPKISLDSAPVSEPAAAPETDGDFKTHVVQPGEDLKSIADFWMVDVEGIRKLNSLTDDALKPGQALKIPPVAE